MKKIISYILVALIAFLCVIPVYAEEANEESTETVEKEKVTLYLFHGQGCPHCAEEKKFLKKIIKNYDIDYKYYEVWYDKENADFMDEVMNVYGVSKGGVPFTVIGDTYFVGYSDAIGESIEDAVKYYQKHDYTDEVTRIKNGEKVKLDDKFTEYERKKDSKMSIDVPVFGKVNLRSVSLMSATVLLGLVDGFNPCAMWVLLFLISVLLGMKDRKRMWALGLSFLITSALVYMVIMFSWLNIVVNMTTSVTIRSIIAVIAIIGGVINLRAFIKSNDSGCDVVDDKKRKKIFKRIKKFTSEKSFIIALGGVIALAISVNLVELACSAGLPIIFTQLLAINKVTGITGFFYTLIYIIFFLIDDIVVFFIAMFTMNATGLSTKYNKFSHLIGGIIMLVVGLLLIFNPDILMFNWS